MKIKKITYTILIGCFLLLNTGCEQWLEVLPENKVLRDEFWQSKQDVEGMLASAYDAFRATEEAIIVHGELRAGALTDGGAIKADAGRIDKFDILPTNSWSSWARYYKAIGYANIIYKMAPVAEQNDPIFYEPEMKSYQAEALFIRALCYFYLVRTWEEVPLITEPYETDKQEFSIAKSSADEVLDQIEADLKIAIGSAKLKFDKLSYTKGRATQWAAKSLLADVYLWRDKYDLAKQLCTDIIQNSGITLTPPEGWFSIYNPGNSVESIFEIQHTTYNKQEGPLYTLFKKDRIYGVSDEFDTYSWNVYNEVTDVRKYGAHYKTTLYKYWGARKMMELEVDPPERSGNARDVNFPIYRIADLYLILAEAQTELNDFEGAKSTLDELRTARGIENKVNVSSDRISLEDFILEERVREFVGEGKEWFDLLRIAKRNNFERKQKLINMALQAVTAKDLPIMRSRLQNPKSYYLPISIGELKNNRKLVQNPYYEDVTEI
jgi:hypothetical protein